MVWKYMCVIQKTKKSNQADQSWEPLLDTRTNSPKIAKVSDNRKIIANSQQKKCFSPQQKRYIRAVLFVALTVNSSPFVLLKENNLILLVLTTELGPSTQQADNIEH
jgi:hypothetical protein